MPEPAIPAQILVFAGHDPSGGAGIQADIEAIAANGGHALPVLTALTVQDSHNVQQLRPLEGDWVRRQAEALLADFPIAAVKIGLLGGVEVIAVIRDLLAKLASDIPLILDPVLAAGGGHALAGTTVEAALRGELLPRCHLLTPNANEARRLSGCDDLEAAASALLQQGCGAVLLTTADESSERVINTLYRPDFPPLALTWPRLPDTYHGSGCTLAAALSAQLGRGVSLEKAVQQAQTYTWQSLQRGYRAGGGQAFPQRIDARRPHANRKSQFPYS